MKKVVNKGYTLTITSWENDGDAYNTKIITIPSLEEAKKIYTICTTLFKSRSNGGIGNTMDGRGNNTLDEYITNNPELFPNLENNEIVHYVNELSFETMGGSPHYDYRVCEIVTVTYSPEDIFVEEITF